MNKVLGCIGVLIVALSSLSVAGPVNVNTADAATLARELDGIGLARAQAIVDWRRKNGEFGSVADLQKVSGVGDKIIRMNHGNIRFEDPRDESD